MKSWIKRNYLYVAGAFIGSVAGLLYWKYVGCSAGTCIITSRPLNSAVYGAVMGSLLFGLFDNRKGKAASTPEKER